MFDGYAPGDAVRCPVDGCGFRGAVGQVAAHVRETADSDHDAVERAIADGAEYTAPDAEGGPPTAVDEFRRLLDAAHDPAARYESDEQGGWLFPFEE